MPTRFCEHLQEYGSLYAEAEEAYRRCNSLVEEILADGPDAEKVEELNGALEAWLQHDQGLRDALVELVTSDKVRIPKKKRNARKRHGVSHCTECRFEIPKLMFSEWEIAYNGTVAFQGDEIHVEAPVHAE